MHWDDRQAVSLAYKLENVVFFCLETVPPQYERRALDMKDVIRLTLAPFKGMPFNDEDVREFKQQNDLCWIEDEARVENKICILVAPNRRTLDLAYGLMRDWCPHGFNYWPFLIIEKTGVVPLFKKPHQ